jgi:serine/threonine-protein kinase ULK4
MRLSRIAGNNLEKDGEGADYTAAQAAADDIMIDSADAELDFEETKEEGMCIEVFHVPGYYLCWGTVV